MELSTCRTSNLADSDQEKTLNMVPRTQEGIHFCYLGTSSGKQKKARSTNQPPFRSKNISVTIDADEISSNLQKLASSINSATFNHNIARNIKLPKSLTTTIPTFSGESQNFELLVDRKNLTEVLTVSCRKYVKPQSLATAKHKFQHLVFNPANQKLIDFMD